MKWYSLHSRYVHGTSRFVLRRALRSVSKLWVWRQLYGVHSCYNDSYIKHTFVWLWRMVDAHWMTCGVRFISFLGGIRAGPTTQRESWIMNHDVPVWGWNMRALFMCLLNVTRVLWWRCRLFNHWGCPVLISDRLHSLYVHATFLQGGTRELKQYIAQLY